MNSLIEITQIINIAVYDIYCYICYIYQGYFWGGGAVTCVEILLRFSAPCRNTFSKKWPFFRKFSRYFYTDPPKTTFYCIFIKKFPQNLQKSAKKIFAALSAPRKTHFRRLRRRKCVEIPQFFRP